jgi:hypothetical protein
MKFMKTLTVVSSLLAIGPAARAAASAEEVKQLGTTLTQFGSEKAGNKDGTIPPYEGGLPTSTKPEGFKPDSGKWTSPYAGEKPLFTITAANLDKYGDKVSEANKALFKRYPEYRMDVYKTYRSANWPQYLLDKTVHNATAAKLDKNGYRVIGVDGGIPFPIPKTGMEAMYNHLLRFQGQANKAQVQNLYVDNSGKLVLSGDITYNLDFPYNWPDAWGKSVDREATMRMSYNFTGPARAAGDSAVWADTVDFEDKPRHAYAYSASTRRIRLAPDVTYDTPISSTGGVMVYDDGVLFAGKMDRYDWKLVGKKEMYIPYNLYDMFFNVKPDVLMGPKFMNPDHVRWELHRVWVVEATLKQGARHVYSKRTYYLDEDWSGAGMADLYDMAGKIYKGNFIGMTQLYDKQVPFAWPTWIYDLSTGAYSAASLMGADDKHGWWIVDKPWQNAMFVPDSLPGRSGR